MIVIINQILLTFVVYIVTLAVVEFNKSTLELIAIEEGSAR